MAVPLAGHHPSRLLSSAGTSGQHVPAKHQAPSHSTGSLWQTHCLLNCQHTAAGTHSVSSVSITLYSAGRVPLSWLPLSHLQPGQAREQQLRAARCWLWSCTGRNIALAVTHSAAGCDRLQPCNGKPAQARPKNHSLPPVNWRWVEEGNGYVGPSSPLGNTTVVFPSGLQCLVPYPYRSKARHLCSRW
jgi:hypothetical protein